MPLDAQAKPASSGLAYVEEEKREQEPNECDESEQTEEALTIKEQGSIDFKSMRTQELFKVAVPVF